MSRFAHESQKSKGDGSSLPLGKKIKKWFFNLKVSLTQDKAHEHGMVSKFGKRK
ncbi:MAG: hypothetical protein WCW44_04385 [archaeon]|jgi:hypothetical protein